MFHCVVPIKVISSQVNFLHCSYAHTCVSLVKVKWAEQGTIDIPECWHFSLNSPGGSYCFLPHHVHFCLLFMLWLLFSPSCLKWMLVGITWSAKWLLSTCWATDGIEKFKIQTYSPVIPFSIQKESWFIRSLYKRNERESNTTKVSL